MTNYLNDVRHLLKSRWFVFCMLAIAVMSYGYAACNTSISIDDTEHDRYVGSGNTMLASGRFGMWFWSVVEGKWENSFLIDFFAVFMLAFACINFCILFKRVSNGKITIGALTVFSCLFISYPLMNEIWEYTGANVNVCGGFLLVSFSLLIIHAFIHGYRGIKGYLSLVGSAILLTLVCAGYESVVSVYVFFVFAIIALQIIYQKENKLWDILKQGFLYAGLLAAGVVLRVIIHNIILAVCNLQPVVNGATSILWGGQPILNTLVGLVDSFFVYYIFRAVIYFPLFVLVLSGLAFLTMGITACIKHGAILLLPGSGMLLSLILFSLIQGVYSPYRICQVFAAFCAFSGMMLVSSFPRDVSKSKTVLRICALTLCGMLCFYQSTNLNYYLELNHRRSESEAAVVRQISYDLRKGFDRDKPVVFVGTYQLSPTIYEAACVPEDGFNWKLYQKLCGKYFYLCNRYFDLESLSRKGPDTNINSVINWSVIAFGTQDATAHLFEYYGCEYVPANLDLYLEPAQAESGNMPAYPKEGYIKDMGDYLIVNLG